jgi:hypothetical protein
LFQHPLGLLALLAVPAVIGLHLFRRRFRPHTVSAVFLWEPLDHSPLAGRKREPLRSSPSFWCELFAALLLALAFAGPRACGAGDATHLVVVLDASASMSAVTGAGPVSERAREVVREAVGGLARGSRVTLVQSGPRPTLLAGPAAYPAEALAALAEFAPGAARHDLGPSVALAQQLAGEGGVLVVTDHDRPGAFPPELALVSVGAPSANLGFTHAARRRGVDAQSGEVVERVLLTVASFADEPRDVTVALSAGGAPLDARRVHVEPGARAHLAFTLPADAPLVRAELPADALAIDDVAYLAPEPPRTLALASTLSRELSTFLGLASPGQERSNIDRWLRLLPDAIDVGDPAAAHLVLSQGIASGSAWCLALAPAGDGELQHLIGPFLSDKSHELLTGVTLDGIVWSARPDTPLSGAPIVSAGDTPLLTEARDGARVVFQANLVAGSSSLHRSPDWPILLTNLAELRRRELPGPARASIAVGEAFVYRDRAPARYRLRGPGGDRELRARGTLVVEDVHVPGVYTLARLPETDDEQPLPLCEVAYSFADAAESDLRAARPGSHAGAETAATLRADFSFVEVLLMVAVLALVGIDWWVLRGRRSAA